MTNKYKNKLITCTRTSLFLLKTSIKLLIITRLRLHRDGQNYLSVPIESAAAIFLDRVIFACNSSNLKFTIQRNVWVCEENRHDERSQAVPNRTNRGKDEINTGEENQNLLAFESTINATNANKDSNSVHNTNGQKI
mmetsp:Transcript_8399/g.24824  ORF Transcript_8399/g.24824 Transcript_8399/m.24824 type:complete len:137 (-) Transcript_8399:721-1131(-)